MSGSFEKLDVPNMMSAFMTLLVNNESAWLQAGRPVTTTGSIPSRIHPARTAGAPGISGIAASRSR